MREYEYKTKQGFLIGMKIKTTEHVTNDSWEHRWIDADFIELLLNIDEVWRTPRQLRKNTGITSSHTAISSFLKKLTDMGVVERRKPNGKHVEYRRVMKYPNHY